MDMRLIVVWLLGICRHRMRNLRVRRRSFIDRVMFITIAGSATIAHPGLLRR